MSYSQENGYLPVTVDTIMASIMENINVQFQTTYTLDTFVGTNFYKYFYALAQRVQSGEVKTAEIFLKLQQFIAITNERISRPVNTSPGIIEKFKSLDYVASIKEMVLADAGKISIAVDVDDGVHALGDVTITSFANLISGTADIVSINGTNFTAQSGAVTPGASTFRAATTNNDTAISLASQINAHATTSLIIKATALGAKVVLRAKQGGTAANAYTISITDNGSVGATKSGATLTGGTINPEYAATKIAIATLISQITVAGTVTQGSESTNVVISNGQSFAYKFFLPDRLPVKLRLTITTSENNQVIIETPDQIKSKLLANINARYWLGKNFEPQRYFSLVDAPWASQVVLQYSLDDGATYTTAIYDAEFDKLFDIGLADIELVEN